MTNPWRLRLVVCCLAVALPLCGCRVVAQVPKSELQKLDGFHPGSVVHLETVDGRRYPFTKRTGLYLQMETGEVQGYHFATIECSSHTLVGTTYTGYVVRVSLYDVESVKVSTLSRGRTLGLVFGIVGGVLVAYVVLVVIALVATGGLS